MKKLALILVCLFTTGFAENIFLDNKTTYPDKKMKIAVQWATSAKEVNQENLAAAHEMKLNSGMIKPVKQTGKMTLSIPKNAEYFRVLVWKEGSEKPELLTNWVDVVPDKTYCLKQDQLTPTVLMLGMGC